MGGHKHYKGYQAYEYLVPGKDYQVFELAQEINRVPGYVVPTTEDQEARVRQLLETSVVISLHDHPTVQPQDLGFIREYIREGREHTAYRALSTSFLDAVFDNLMDGTAMITSKMGWKWSDTIYDIGMRLCDIAHQDFVVVGKNASDIRSAHKNGQLALFLALEAATSIENEVDRIDILYGLGIRMMGIAYCESNQLGSGQEEDRDGGLTHFGHQAVGRMNRIGMAIDISHSDERTSLDVIEASRKPVFLTHGGARGLCLEDMPNYRRCAPDSVIEACGQAGGVIGIEAAPHQTITVNHTEHTIDAMMEHFEYVKDLVGIDHITFGPDTLYGDHVGLHHAFADQLSITPSNYPEVDYVKGIENPSEAFPNIVRWLVIHNYSNEEIHKVIGENTLRVLNDVWVG